MQGLPIAHGSTIGWYTPSVALMISAAVDEETGCTNQRELHPHLVEVVQMACF